MSDLHEFELEDIVSDFGDNDDHIVPHPGGKKSSCAAKRDSFQRQRTELKRAGSNADNGCAVENVIDRKEEVSFEALKQGMETMLEKNPWSHSSSGNCSASLDDGPDRNNPCSTSDERWASKQCLQSSNMSSAGSDFCADGPILGDQTVHRQLNNDNQSKSDLALFGNGLEDKDIDDLLLYGWPDLENFEDVDNIFRSCDSTFGLDLDDNDDMSWLSSLHAIGGSDDALKSNFDFSGRNPCGPTSVTEQEFYGLSNDEMVDTEGFKKLSPVLARNDFQNSVASAMNAYVTESAAIPHSDTQSQCQMPAHVSPSKHRQSLKETGKHQPFDDGVSYIHFDNLNNGVDVNHLLNPQNSLLPDNGQQQEISNQTGLQTPMSVVKPCNSHPSNHSLPTSSPSLMKSQGGVISSVTLGDSSHASKQMQSVQSFHDVSTQNPNFSGNKKKDRHHQRRLARHNNKANFKGGRAHAKKTAFCSENEAEGESEVDGNGIQESSCVSSVVDEVSVDASSLQQLQHVMEQLDIRTKLCIRDSLYRLAKSAEQRHKCFTQSSGKADDKDANGALLSDGANKCAGFMDIETDTNPIDRSIAHLLFHRPSDMSAAAKASDTVVLKSQPLVPAAPNPEKPVYREETTPTKEETAEAS